MSATNSTDISPSQSPISSHNAPKFGTMVPNRIFVGGIPGNANEDELLQLFSVYGKVRQTKIICDRAGVSKGYGFVTFDNEEEANRVKNEESITLKDRKLNIAPAIRKQPFSRVYGSPEAPTERINAPRQPRNSGDWSVVSSVATTPSTDPAPYVPNGTVFYHGSGASYYNPGGVIFTAADGTCQFAPSQALYPVMYSPTAVYIPQQYQSYQSPSAAQAHWTGQPVCWTSHLGYGQTSGSSFATTLPAADGLPFVPTPPSFLPNVSPSTSTASAPQFVYSPNTGITTSTASHANNTVSTTMTSLQPQNIGEPACAASTPIAAAAVAYSYPPPPIIAPYPSANGDVIDMSMMENSADQSQHTQDSVGLAKPCNAGLNAVVRFVHALPQLSQDFDECHLPYFKQGTPSIAATRGYHKGYHPSVKLHQQSQHVPHHFGLPQQQYSPQHRGKLRGMGSQAYSHHVCAAPTSMNSTPPATANGKINSLKPMRTPNTVVTPLTPPPTPMASGMALSAENTLDDTTQKFKTLNI